MGVTSQGWQPRTQRGTLAGRADGRRGLLAWWCDRVDSGDYAQAFPDVSGP